MKREKVTDAIVIGMLRSNNYIDGSFNSLQKDVFVWANRSEHAEIDQLLSTASKNLTNEAGYPEFIIFDAKNNLVIVIENKRDAKYHVYNDINKNIKKYAVNGALWYAAKLKEKFDTIAIAISGDRLENIIIDTYAWKKEAETFSNLNIHEILQIDKYRNIILKKEKNIKSVSELRYLNETAKQINEYLRDYLGVMEHKRLYILGSILFALEDPVFKMTYSLYNNNKDLSTYLYQTIDRKTKNSGLKHADIIRAELRPTIEGLGDSEKEGAKNEYPNGTLLELIRRVDNILYEYYKNSELDLISIFFNVFLSYSTSGGSDLGIVLTPSHITKLFSELANVDLNSKILDPCVGTGGFLTSAWKRIFFDGRYSPVEKENFRKNNLFGVESENSIYTIVALNMFLNKDGRSNLYKKDCFSLKDELTEKECNVGFVNPPYSDEIYPEIAFVELMLDVLLPNSIGIAIVPVNAVSSRTKKHNGLNTIKKRILSKHTLLASIQMPIQLFYPKGTETIILIFETGKAHSDLTWFAKFDDGYELLKHQQMRTPGLESDKKFSELVDAYKSKAETDFSFSKLVNEKDQWVYTLHNDVEYDLEFDDFQSTVNDYVSYLIKNRYTLKASDVPSKDEVNLTFKKVNLTDYFTISAAKQKDKMYLTVADITDLSSVPFMGRRAANNGISDYVLKDEDCFNDGKIMTVALDGSTGATFYQHHGFCSGQNIWIIKPIDEKISVFTPFIALFFVTCISKAVEAYSYNLSLTKTRLEKIKIYLPFDSDDEIDYENIGTYMGRMINSQFCIDVAETRY